MSEVELQKDRCQLRIVMVYYHVHARRRKCAMIRWTFQCARDVGTRERAASTCPVVTSTCPTTCPTTCP